MQTAVAANRTALPRQIKLRSRRSLINCLKISQHALVRLTMKLWVESACMDVMSGLVSTLCRNQTCNALAAPKLIRRTGSALSMLATDVDSPTRMIHSHLQNWAGFQCVQLASDKENVSLGTMLGLAITRSKLITYSALAGAKFKKGNGNVQTLPRTDVNLQNIPCWKMKRTKEKRIRKRKSIQQTGLADFDVSISFAPGRWPLVGKL